MLRTPSFSTVPIKRPPTRRAGIGIGHHVAHGETLAAANHLDFWGVRVRLGCECHQRLFFARAGFDILDTRGRDLGHGHPGQQAEIEHFRGLGIEIAQKFAKVGFGHLAVEMVLEVPQTLGDMRPFVADIVGRHGFEPAPLEDAHQCIAQGRIAGVTHVKRLVGIGLRILDHDPFTHGRARGEIAAIENARHDFGGKRGLVNLEIDGRAPGRSPRQGMAPRLNSR